MASNKSVRNWPVKTIPWQTHYQMLTRHAYPCWQPVHCCQGPCLLSTADCALCLAKETFSSNRWCTTDYWTRRSSASFMLSLLMWETAKLKAGWGREEPSTWFTSSEELWLQFWPLTGWGLWPNILAPFSSGQMAPEDALEFKFVWENPEAGICHVSKMFLWQIIWLRNNKEQDYYYCWGIKTYLMTFGQILFMVFMLLDKCISL